jgi:hypothetical protein
MLINPRLGRWRYLVSPTPGLARLADVITWPWVESV